MTFIFAEPKEWWLEVLPSTRAECWEQSQQHATSNSRWNAYINQVCLNVFLEKMQADNAPEANIWLDTTQVSAVWEIVNGSAIAIGGTRFILIPAEAIDDGELEVPQEWVDIPSWAGDYYIAVQIRPEGDILRAWGYTTHHELKTKANYDASDRTYCIDAEDLNCDMNALWVGCQFYPEAQTREAVSILPELSTAQAENLIKRLGNSSILFPRLAIPFATWGALLENENWRQRLFEIRIGLTDLSAERFTCLSEWFQETFDAVWQTMEDVFSPQKPAINWRNKNSLINRVKVLDFGFQSNNEQIALLVGTSQMSNNEVNINVQILPTGNNLYLPNEVRAILLDENGDEIGQASASITQTIELQFCGQVGEKFSIQVTCGSKNITENFVI